MNAPKFETKTVLVTGGAGFLGSHLCERLLERGNAVLCVDNLDTGAIENIRHLLENPMFRFLKHDVTLPLHEDVDEIFNLACPASPVSYQRDPIQTVKTSVLGACNMLELAHRKGCKILQTSTSEVYGDPLHHPQSEDYWGNVNPVGLRSCYDEGKRCAETLFFDYHRQHGTRIKVARIFNTYGPRMQPTDGRVVSNFIVQALQGQPLTIYGNGLQSRSFCYVDDQIDALLRLMETGDDVTGPINLGAAHEITIRDLATTIAEEIGHNTSVIFSDLPSDDPVQRRPDISKAKSVLGWQPATTLSNGIRQTVQYFREVLDMTPDMTQAKLELP